MLMASVYHIRSSGAGAAKTHKLVFTTTSLRNVVLANASDVLYYEVVTPAWERHRTRVTRLDVKTQEFAIVAEMLNGHAPGDTRGGEDEAKQPMALRMYGGGEYTAVHDFLHFEEGRERGEIVGAGADAGKDRKGKGKMQDDGEEMSDSFWPSLVGRAHADVSPKTGVVPWQRRQEVHMVRRQEAVRGVSVTVYALWRYVVELTGCSCCGTTARTNRWRLITRRSGCCTSSGCRSILTSKSTAIPPSSRAWTTLSVSAVQ